MALERILFCSTNNFDNGVALDKSNEDVLFPIANIKTNYPWKRWHSADLVTPWVGGDLTGVPRLFMVAGHNGTASATWRIRLGTDSATVTSAPLYDSGFISMYDSGVSQSQWSSKTAVHILAATGYPTAAYGRIDFSDASNPQGHFQVGRVIMNGVFEPAVNLSFGWNVQLEDDSEHDYSLGGNLSVTPGGRRRVLRFGLDFASEAEMYETLHAFDTDHGKRKGFVIAPVPTSAYVTEQTFYGVLKQTGQIVNPRYQIFKRKYEFVELT